MSHRAVFYYKYLPSSSALSSVAHCIRSRIEAPLKTSHIALAIALAIANVQYSFKKGSSSYTIQLKFNL